LAFVALAGESAHFVVHQIMSDVDRDGYPDDEELRQLALGASEFYNYLQVRAIALSCLHTNIGVSNMIGRRTQPTQAHLPKHTKHRCIYGKASTPNQRTRMKKGKKR